METKTEIQLAAQHIDSLGHLNHVQAVRLLELAREDWYRACGLYGQGETRKFAAVVVNINYDYRRECFAGEPLKITTTPVTMGRKSFTLTHQIIKPDGEVAISGNATSLIMDLQSRAMIPVPQCMAVHFS